MVHAAVTGFAGFHQPLRAVVIGASGGIGGALCAALASDPAVAEVFAFARQPPAGGLARVQTGAIDLEDEASIREAAALAGAGGALDLVLVASGLLHAPGLAPEKRWEALDAGALARLFAVNATGPALCARYFLPHLRRGSTSVFAALSARVGSISDNRAGGWYGYRASKAALNMLLKTLALELARRNPDAVCVGLHPGTVDTGLSRPFQSRVPDGKLFTPERAASQLLTVCAQLTPARSGQVLAWDGSPVPA